MGNSNSSDSDRKIRSDQGGKIRGSIGDAAIGQSPTKSRPAPPVPDHNPNKEAFLNYKGIPMGNPSNDNSDSNGKAPKPSDQGGSIGKPRADTTIGQSTTPNRPPPPLPDHNPNK